MAAYLSGSNVQADSMQTLHLMNPGYGGYADASSAGNLMLVNHSAAAIGKNDSAGNSSQQQHSYRGYPHSSPGQQSTFAAMHTSQQSPSGLFTNRLGGNNPYTWTTTNELSFLPSNEVTQLNQSLAARLTSMTSEPQLGSNLSHFNIGRQSISDEQVSMLPKGMALGLNVAHAHDSDGGPSRGLSLSLSPQQHLIQMQYYGSMQSDEPTTIPGLTHVAGNESGYKGDRMANTGNLSRLRSPSMDLALGTGLQKYMNDMGSSRHTHPQQEVSSIMMGSGGFFTGTKYLKAAQHLLDEVVSVEAPIKNSPTKHVKPQTWMAHGSLADTSAMEGMAVTGMTAKEGIPWGPSTGKVASCPDIATAAAAGLTPQARQELQMKKAKLIAMLEEVDRRYKLYYSQMQAIVSSFESPAGLGAAKSYTALALQTISRHFRCLRDAVTGQIQVAATGLGEEEQLHQIGALQQLQMMQQHAWRPQRGLPERAVSILRAWLFEHFLHPYPKDADKTLLAKQTGLTRNQVSNWFINARVRLWKPMVEEMYQEEVKESEMPANQRSDDTGEEGDDDLRAEPAAQRNPHGKSTRGSEQARIEDGNNDEGERKIGLHHQFARITKNSAAEATNTADSDILLHKRQGVKKPRSSIESFATKTEVYSDVQDLKDECKGKEDSKLSFSAIRVQGHDGINRVLHQLTGGSLERRHGDPVIAAVPTAQDYYSSMAVTNSSSNRYEALSQLRNQKRSAEHILYHNFNSLN